MIAWARRHALHVTAHLPEALCPDCRCRSSRRMAEAFAMARGARAQIGGR